MSISLGILFNLHYVNIAIHLDNQTGSVTIKIDNKTIYHLLAAEMPASKFVCPQGMPEERFSGRHILAQFPGPLVFFGCDFLADNSVFDRHGF
jgi:hypothetical protein